MADVHNTSSEGLIIGGGIAGLAAALFLKRAGIRVRIFEAYPRITNIGGSLQVFPNGMRILSVLGLERKVLDSGGLMTETLFKDHKGRAFARVSLETAERYQHQTITIRRAALHEMLSEECEKNGIRVEYEKRLCRIIDSPTRIAGQFDDGTEAVGKFLIGADGVHSFVRKHILPDFPGALSSDLVSFSGFVPERAVHERYRPGTSLKITIGPIGFFGYCYTDNTNKADPHIFWWCYLSPKNKLSKAEVATMTEDDIRQKILNAHGNWPEPIGTLIRNYTSVYKVFLSDIMGLEKWHKGRALIVGDAAHAMNPINGQGASTSLEDAMLLAELFKQYPDQIHEVFEKFEAARKPRVEKMVAMGRKSSQRSMVRVGRFGYGLRNAIFAVLTRLTSQNWSDWMYCYDPLRDRVLSQN